MQDQPYILPYCRWGKLGRCRLRGFSAGKGGSMLLAATSFKGILFVLLMARLVSPCPAGANCVLHSMGI